MKRNSPVIYKGRIHYVSDIPDDKKIILRPPNAVVPGECIEALISEVRDLRVFFFDKIEQIVRLLIEWERWEDKLINDDRCWQSEQGTPIFTEEIFAKYLRLIVMRTEILER